MSDYWFDNGQWLSTDQSDLGVVVLGSDTAVALYSSFGGKFVEPMLQAGFKKITKKEFEVWAKKQAVLSTEHQTNVRSVKEKLGKLGFSESEISLFSFGKES